MSFGKDGVQRAMQFGSIEWARQREGRDLAARMHAGIGAAGGTTRTRVAKSAPARSRCAAWMES